MTWTLRAWRQSSLARRWPSLSWNRNCINCIQLREQKQVPGVKRWKKLNRKIFLESEVEKLRLANDKLRYRINILKLATAEELSQAAGEKDLEDKI